MAGRESESVKVADEDRIFETLWLPLIRQGYSPLNIATSFNSVIATLIGHWNFFWLSGAPGHAFLSNRMSKLMSPINSDRTPDGDDRVHAYKLCQVTMSHELGYAPDVNDIDDLLRLRHDKRITRFRQLLDQWCRILPSGDAALIKGIKKDILKANRELRHLNQWRTVDRWLFWAQLPTTLIPILSTVVTVASFGVHLQVERSEKNTWIGIGR
jgi:hypothetical protein